MAAQQVIQKCGLLCPVMQRICGMSWGITTKGGEDAPICHQTGGGRKKAKKKDSLKYENKK